MHTLTSPLEALASTRDGVVAVDRADLATISLGGADALAYLHAVCSQHTVDLRPGDATEALLLSPKGRIEFAFRLAVHDGGVLLDADAGAAAALADRLARFVFRYDVTVAEPAKGAVSLLGPGADGALTAADLPTPGPGLVVHRTAVGVDLVGPDAPGAAASIERAGVAVGPVELWELVRVERGLPRAGRELTDDVLAEEAGLLGSHVHLDKGCCPARRPSSVTRSVGGAGQLRSVVDHPELGPIGLAYVRRVVEPGRLVLADTHPATVVELPFR